MDAMAGLKREAAAAADVLQRFNSMVDQYLELTGRSQTEFGEAAVGSADFVRHVRGGRDFRLSTVLRCLDHMRS